MQTTASKRLCTYTIQIQSTELELYTRGLINQFLKNVHNLLLNGNFR